MRRPRPSKEGVRQQAIFAFAYLAYFGVRAITEGGVAAADANARTLIDLKRELGVAWEAAWQEAAAHQPDRHRRGQCRLRPPSRRRD